MTMKHEKINSIWISYFFGMTMKEGEEEEEEGDRR
jgi:hypothetical protein